MPSATLGAPGGLVSLRIFTSHFVYMFASSRSLRQSRLCCAAEFLTSADAWARGGPFHLRFKNH